MLYYVQTESNYKCMSMCLCVCLLFVCLTKLKRRGNLSSVFSLLIPMWVCVCVFVFKSARVLVFFLYFLHTTFWTSLTWKNYSKASTDDDDSTRSSALFVVRKVYNNFITFSQSDSDLKFGYSEMGTRRSCCTFSFKFGDSNRRREEERRLLRQLCL